MHCKNTKYYFSNTGTNWSVFGKVSKKLMILNEKAKLLLKRQNDVTECDHMILPYSSFAIIAATRLPCPSCMHPCWLALECFGFTGGVYMIQSRDKKSPFHR